MSDTSPLQQARERLGLSDEEVLSRAGIDRNRYLDLEAYEDDIWMSASIGELRALGAVLQIPPASLLGVVQDDPPVSVTDLVTAIRRRIQVQDHSLDAFEARAGWTVGPLLEDPQALDRLCPDAFVDICDAAGVVWQRAFPRT